MPLRRAGARRQARASACRSAEGRRGSPLERAAERGPWPPPREVLSRSAVGASSAIYRERESERSWLRACATSQALPAARAPAPPHEGADCHGPLPPLSRVEETGRKRLGEEEIGGTHKRLNNSMKLVNETMH